MEFVGVHAPIHHQCFQMVEMLIHHHRRDVKTLNPFAKPYEPNTEVEEENIKEEIQQIDSRTHKIIEKRKTDGHFHLNV